MPSDEEEKKETDAKERKKRGGISVGKIGRSRSLEREHEFVIGGRGAEREGTGTGTGRTPRFSAMAPAILPHGVTSIKPCNLNVNISIRNDRA